MKLNELPKLKGRTKANKRVGRGGASGKGFHTSARGMKGQNARNSVRPGFEGGQNPLYKALPQKKGMKPLRKTVYVAVNVRDLDRKFDDGATVNMESLRKAGLVGKNDEAVKLLGTGDIKAKVTVEGIKVSEAAKAKVEKAGGKVS